jgi:hypothetical protein
VRPDIDMVMIASASTNATGNNQTKDVPVLVFPPPSLFSSDHASNANANRTNATQEPPTGNYTNGTALGTEGPRQIIQSKPTGNYTNGTALGTEGPRQIITGRPAMGQLIPQHQLGQNTSSGNDVIRIPNINITKEQAVKAEQEANVMIKAYYEKLEQEKQKQKEREQAAAAQANQIMDNATQTEGSQGDIAALAEETVTDIEDNAQQEEEVEADEDEESDNEDEDSEQDDD